MLKLEDVLELVPEKQPPTCWGKCHRCNYETELNKKQETRPAGKKKKIKQVIVFLCQFCSTNDNPHPNYVANAIIDALSRNSPTRVDPTHRALFVMGSITAQGKFTIVSTPHGVVVVPAKTQTELFAVAREHSAMYRVLDNGARLLRLSVPEDPAVPRPPKEVTLEEPLRTKVIEAVAALEVDEE